MGLISRVSSRTYRPKMAEYFAELIRLISLTSNEQVKNFLQAEADKYKPAPVVKKPIVTPKGKIQTKISTYSWDQTDARLKFYIRGVTGVESENVKLDLEGDYLKMTAIGEQKIFNFELFLTAEITDEKPIVKVKPDYVYVSVAKKDKKKWESLTRNDKIKKTAEKDKFKADDDDDMKADPSASIMKMMKKMYDEGDDDMKRNLNKAWEQAQNKKQGAAGDMPDMDM